MRFAYLILWFFGSIIGKFIYDEIKRVKEEKEREKDERNIVETVNDICSKMENEKLLQINDDTFMLGNVKIKVTNCDDIEKIKNIMSL